MNNLSHEICVCLALTFILSQQVLAHRVVQVYSSDSLFYCEGNKIQYDYRFYGSSEIRKAVFFRFTVKRKNDSISYRYYAKEDSIFDDETESLPLMDSAFDVDTLGFRHMLQTISSYTKEEYTRKNGECQSQEGSRSFFWGRTDEDCGQICCMVCTTKENEIYQIENDFWGWILLKFNNKYYGDVKEAGSIVVKKEKTFFEKLFDSFEDKK